VFTSDASRACRNKEVLDGLGTIKLDLFHGEVGKPVLNNVSYYKGPEDQSPIHKTHQPDMDMTERIA